ncbi:putative nitric oxide synthase [Aspergillus heteromorphus CBS 117.55]|uniref:nitric-oxide synthase (NADPH) n=1 Tax=Aspergillus heteromorphus CBS 117.55 TaxID=1448321 RepID=A0A317WSM1_9EURO|nr:putative nitric oxide synthase [Aspergillus heteromorphus CBS 117.55]PWY88332.1 putative nitric oxide synthase [Aspergillus heteromorphus CBS 117.55]
MVHNSLNPLTETMPMTMSTSPSQCPFREYEKIISKNPILTPTGCTEQFCQAGRMNHTDEPKIGENRPLETVRDEASGFLWQLWQDGIYTEHEYNERRTQVMDEIERSAKEKIVWSREVKRVSKTSTWTQTPEELRYGLRLAWRNSRKCIMRSRYQELELCDLRRVNTSVGMATAILEEVTKSFNNGQITPTVFVFPPKSVDGNGPMFWNKQVLNFAAYELDNGSVLGDPSNVQLTKDIIDLGWTPPTPKGRWDLLPIVAMAENDAPALVEIPDNLRRLIDIEHPDYPGIGKLDLKWYQFPALSRLGFDIGGVQYTAAPFLGWYMDAEIGVRNLADTFRFDSLPDVAKAVGFSIDSYRQRQEYSEIREMGDLPDYEQLRWLSRAQAELNYAVRWSFLKKGVTCVGTLAASSDWCQYDDDHAEKNGYRLNSDPYWLSPPQGSIVPVWHRGGAPNYQPKPMICRNRYDPVKSWQRQKSATEAYPVRLVRKEGSWVTEVLSPFTSNPSERNGSTATEAVSEAKLNTVRICYCSKGTTARILADKLHNSVKKCAKTFRVAFSSLNALDLHKVDPSDVILVVASTTGSGTFPTNGDEFAKSTRHLLKTLTTDFSQLRVSVFGVGDSAYPNFNAAAIDVYNFFSKLGVSPIAGGLVKADVASEALPLRLFHRWLDVVESSLTGGIDELTENPEDELIAQGEMLRKFNSATLVSKSSPSGEEDGLILMALDGIEHAEMTHLRLLPTNSPSQVSRALAALGIDNPHQQMPFSDRKLQQWTYQDFFLYLVDLEDRFKTQSWTTQPRKYNEPVLETLERLINPSQLTDPLRLSICLDIPLLRPRAFSVASSTHYLGDKKVELLIKPHRQGRFSETYLSTLSPDALVKYCLVPTSPASDLPVVQKPLIAITTGSGFAPVRSLLQQRIHIAQASEGRNTCPFRPSPISLFAGFRRVDEDIIRSTASLAEEHGVVDLSCLVPSNREKKRVQDFLWDRRDEVRAKLVDQGGYVYVCGSAVMVEGVRGKLGEMLGADVALSLGDRYVEEVF